MLEKRNKILVGMSGGVDSSVAALILKKKGFDVTGGFMDLKEENEKDYFPESGNTARDIAKIIGIPFCIFNLKEEFKKKIINGFIKDYQSGITPNPCVDCNKEIKFGLFYERALIMGFDYIATGHYARIKKGRLLKGKDKKKDQCYFLWRLNRKQLEKIIFPLGDYTKEQTRALAKKHCLPCFDSEESQEVCFIKNETTDFLKEKLGQKEGIITDLKGKKLGKHQGLWFHTIGQRKGINLSGGPYFVVDKNIKDNILIISKRKKDLLKKEFNVGQINWVKEDISEFPLKIKVKIRYGHNPVLAEIRDVLGDECKIVFDRPQKAVTPGQSAVFYRGIELIGGGKILENNKAEIN